MPDADKPTAGAESGIEQVPVSPGRLTRIKGQYVASRQKVDAARADLIASRERHASLDLALSVGEHDKLAGGGLLAGALAFRLFLWILPATLVVVGGLGFAVPREAAADATKAGLGAFTAQSIEQASAQAHRARWVVLLIGLFLLYFASVTLAKTVVAATALAWQVPIPKLERAPRSALVTTAALLGGTVLALVANWLRDRRPGVGLIVLLLLIIVWVVIWWLVSLLLPRPPRATWLDLLPGAVLFGVGMELLHLATVLYLSHKVSTASRLYGALGAAATLLLWAYLLSRLVVATAALNATWVGRRSRGSSEAASTPVDPAD